ncbi:hypothetical protein DSO57_1026736, partial [Entomophthora muscae]
DNHGQPSLCNLLVSRLQGKGRPGPQQIPLCSGIYEGGFMPMFPDKFVFYWDNSVDISQVDKFAGLGSSVLTFLTEEQGQGLTKDFEGGETSMRHGTIFHQEKGAYEEIICLFGSKTGADTAMGANVFIIEWKQPSQGQNIAPAQQTGSW